MRVTVGDSGLCCILCVAYLESYLTPCVLILHKHYKFHIIVNMSYI